MVGPEEGFCFFARAMLQHLQIDCSIKPQEVKRLADFLKAIGFEPVYEASGAKVSALLSAPRGVLAINMLPDLSASRVITLGVSNPDVAFDIAQKFGYRVLSDSASDGRARRRPEAGAAEDGSRVFALRLPGDIVLNIVGAPEQPAPGLEGALDSRGKRFAIVVSRFNAFITERLLTGAMDGLLRSGASGKDIHVVRVPGAFEIPSVARALALTKKYDAIICIGCLLRGDTAHYDVIVNEATRGIGQSAQETGIPHAFGVLTCDTLEQAIDRAGLKMGNKGFEAALAAVEMASLQKAIGRRSSAVRKKQNPPSARKDKSKKKSKR